MRKKLHHTTQKRSVPTKEGYNVWKKWYIYIYIYGFTMCGTRGIYIWVHLTINFRKLQNYVITYTNYETALTKRRLLHYSKVVS